MNVEIGTKATQFLFLEYINGIFVAVLSGMKQTLQYLHHVKCTMYFITQQNK
jgi:hypothetical protein